MNLYPRPDIALRLNGELHVMPASTTVADVVRGAVADGEARALAVARNGAIVPRAEWTTTQLAEGDTIEIVRPVQGG